MKQCRRWSSTGREGQGAGERSKNFADELISDKDTVGTNLHAVMEVLAKLNDMCVAKAMKSAEKLQKRAAEPSGTEVEEAVSIELNRARGNHLTCR